MFGKKKNTKLEPTPEELARKEIIYKRCAIVLVILTVLVFVYLIAQMVLIFNQPK